MRGLAISVIIGVGLLVPVGTSVGIGITEGWRNGVVAAAMWVGCGILVAGMMWAIKWAAEHL